MSTSASRRLRATTMLFGALFVAQVLSGRATGVRGAQAAPAPALDRALSANDLREARRLVPENWAAAEQLFISYLERAFITPDTKPSQPEARTLAARLGEVFFRIVEYDFASSLVTTMDTADAGKRQQLMAVVRDYYAALERLRVALAPEWKGATRAQNLERWDLATAFTAIADRFRDLAFRRGELLALRPMEGVVGDDGRPVFFLPGSGPAARRADGVATELGDERSLVRKRPLTEVSLALAMRLGLPATQIEIAETLTSSMAISTATSSVMEQAAQYLELARVASHQVPALETVKSSIDSQEAPRASVTILPRLWAVYQKLQRPDKARALLIEATELSRPFGEPALRRTILRFASEAASARLNWEVVEPLVQAAVKISPRAGLEVLSGLRIVITASLQPEPAEQALALYDSLVRASLASDDKNLVFDVLADRAVLELRTGKAALAAVTFTDAIERAERAGDFRKAAQIASGAIAWRNPSLPAAFRAELAGRAVDAATKADDPYEQARALLARTQMSIGANNQDLQDLQRAVAAAERHTAASGGDVRQEMKCLMALVSEHKARGEYQAAIAVLERSAERERTFRYPPTETSDAAAIYRQMTEIYLNFLGEPGLALTAADRARQLSVASTVQPGSANYDRALMNAQMAALYRSLRQPVAALDAYDKALAAYAEVASVSAVAARSVMTARRNTLQLRQTYLTELGDYEAALRDLNDLRPLIVNAAGVIDPLNNALWLARAVRAHTLAGHREQALVLARKATEELRQTDKSVSWIGLNNIDAIVHALLEANHPDEAIAFCDSYFKEVLARPVAQPVIEEYYLETVARIEVGLGRFNQARVKLDAALEIDRKQPTAEIGGLSASRLALGNLEIAAGNYEAARSHLDAARDAAGPYDFDRIWQIERALGVALVRAGQATNAEAHYANALTTLESVPERLRPEEFRLKYGFDRWQVYDEYAGLLAAKAVRSGLLADAQQAFQAAERKRTQMLWGLLATGWSRLPTDAMPDQLRRAFDLEARIAAKQAVLRGGSGEALEAKPEVVTKSEVANNADKPDARNSEQLRGDLVQIQAEHAQLLTSIAQGQYRYAAPTNLAASLAMPVRAALRTTRVLVEYLVMDDRSYAFVVAQSGVRVIPLAAGRKQLRLQVDHLLLPFKQIRTGEVDLARLTYDTRAAYDLHQTIFAPVRAALGSASEVLIVPDDVLNTLPFEALVDRLPRNLPRGPVLHGELADESFLIRRYAIGYLTSSAQLLSAADRPTADRAPARLFAMANPTAGRAEPASPQDDPLKRQLRSAGFDSFYKPLPGSEIEVARIAQYFGKDATTILMRGEATEAAYKSQAGQYSIVHFATHAVASDGQPLYSTMLLAPDGPAGNDGFLQAYEVLRTPLRADLVVLSGCETALGAEDWGQGLVGLVAAFEQAGARSVLATLWSIDESAADMMGPFYAAMAHGQSTPAALRQAKLGLLQQRVKLGNVEVSLAHPFFWAPFKLVGAPVGR